MGIQMGVTIALGAYFGVWLDEKFTNQYQVFTIVLSLFAIFASLYSIIKQLTSMDKSKNKH